MKKQSKRKYPDAMHEAMDIPEYTKPNVDDGSPSVGKRKKNKHERSESKKFERREKRMGSEPEYQ